MISIQYFFETNLVCPPNNTAAGCNIFVAKGFSLNY